MNVGTGKCLECILSLLFVFFFRFFLNHLENLEFVSASVAFLKDKITDDVQKCWEEILNICPYTYTHCTPHSSSQKQTETIEVNHNQLKGRGVSPDVPDASTSQLPHLRLGGHRRRNRKIEIQRKTMFAMRLCLL